MKEIILDAARMNDRTAFLAYMNELFQFDEPAVNLDALSDDLSEISDATRFVLTQKNVRMICENASAYKYLILIGKACEHNPYLTIVFRK